MRSIWNPTPTHIEHPHQSLKIIVIELDSGITTRREGTTATTATATAATTATTTTATETRKENYSLNSTHKPLNIKVAADLAGALHAFPEAPVDRTRHAKARLRIVGRERQSTATFVAREIRIRIWGAKLKTGTNRARQRLGRRSKDGRPKLSSKTTGRFEAIRAFQDISRQPPLIVPSFFADRVRAACTKYMLRGNLPPGEYKRWKARRAPAWLARAGNKHRGTRSYDAQP